MAKVGKLAPEAFAHAKAAMLRLRALGAASAAAAAPRAAQAQAASLSQSPTSAAAAKVRAHGVQAAHEAYNDAAVAVFEASAPVLFEARSLSHHHQQQQRRLHPYAELQRRSSPLLPLLLLVRQVEQRVDKVGG